MIINRDFLLDTIRKTLSSRSCPFLCEAQLQFELAWKIKERITDRQIEVMFEVPTLTKDINNTPKRNYTDLVIKDGNDNIAIELKFKTRNTDLYGFKTHGAQDLGRYDFLADMYRLEELVCDEIEHNRIDDGMIDIANKRRVNKTKPDTKDDELKITNRKRTYTITRGYAIFLTNDSYYWTMTKTAENDKQDCHIVNNDDKLKYCGNTQYHDFCIANDDATTTGKLDWLCREGKSQERNCVSLYSESIRATWRGRPLQFMHNYNFKWEATGMEEFAMLVVEIKNK